MISMICFTVYYNKMLFTLFCLLFEFQSPIHAEHVNCRYSILERGLFGKYKSLNKQHTNGNRNVQLSPLSNTIEFTMGYPTNAPQLLHYYAHQLAVKCIIFFREEGNSFEILYFHSNGRQNLKL